MRVAGRGYRDGARNLEVMLESLSGGRRREIQEDGIVLEVKKYVDYVDSGCVIHRFLCIVSYITFIYLNSHNTVKSHLKTEQICAENIKKRN